MLNATLFDAVTAYAKDATLNVRVQPRTADEDDETTS